MSVFVIAEAGVNHNGRLDTALKLIDAAASAGASAVKFQLFEPSKLVDKSALAAPYQQKASIRKSQYEMLRDLSLPREAFFDLKDYADDKKIEFLVTPFDLDSAEFLMDELGLTSIKLSSGDIDNFQLIRAVNQRKCKLIISTGASSLDDCLRAREQLVDDNFIFMHCTSAYPAPPEDLNLLAITTMSEILECSIGYSDHSLGFLASYCAVTLGAVAIEKHITLDRYDSGPDHMASMEPDDFRELVTGIRGVETLLGVNVKEVQPSEYENRSLIRRSLVYRNRLEEGHVLTANDVEAIRPGGGLAPSNFYHILGKSLIRPVESGEKIALGHFDD